MKSKISSILFILLIASILLLFTTRFDNDGWFLLNSGRYVENYGIPHTEPFTIHDGFHFVMQQWLFALGLWKIYEIGQMQGMLFFNWIMGGLLIFGYYRLLQLSDDNDITISRLLTIPAAFLLSFYICQRPQIASGLIFLIELYTLEYAGKKAKPPKYVYALFFVLSLILINVHAAMWPMMSVFILPYVVESLLKNRLPGFCYTFQWKWKYAVLLWIPVIAAGFFNPYGLEAMTYAFQSYGYTNINSIVTEMHPLAIGTNTYASIILPIVIGLIIIYARNPLPLHWVLLFAGTAFMAFLAIRSIFLLLIAGTFPLAHILHQHSFKQKSQTTASWKRTWPLMVLMHIAAIIGVFCIFLKNTIPSERLIPLCTIIFLIFLLSIACGYIMFKQRHTPESLKSNARNLFSSLVMLLLVPLFYLYFNTPFVNPALQKSIDIIQQDSAGKPVYLWTGYDEGPYAEFHGLPCYMDTRAEVFLPKLNHKKDVFSEYVNLISGALDYHDFMKRYHFTHLLTTTNDPLYAYLKNDKDYILLWDSDTDDSISEKERKNLSKKYRVYKYQPE